MARREMDELCLQAEEAEGGIKQLGVTDGFLLHPGQLLLVVAARIRKSSAEDIAAPLQLAEMSHLFVGRQEVIDCQTDKFIFFYQYDHDERRAACDKNIYD